MRGQLIFANAAHYYLVEINPRTGFTTILKYVVVHDIGRKLNPLIVAEMVHGSTVDGIGAALLEEFRCDESGQQLTSTFMDYLKLTSADVPNIEVGRLETPSPFTPLGLNGVGDVSRTATPESPATSSSSWRSSATRSA